MSQFWTAFGAALLAAVLALGGNSLQLYLQDRAKRRGEGREFVRQLQPDTVDVVTDLDLLIRSLRASAVTGSIIAGRDPRQIWEERWEGDLLRRLRRLVYGHPDPEVRAAAEEVEDQMWPFLTMTVDLEQVTDRPAAPRYSQEKRFKAIRAADTAMIGLRRAVYSAPYRDLPRSANYSGELRLPKIARLTEDDD